MKRNEITTYFQHSLADQSLMAFKPKDAIGQMDIEPDCLRTGKVPDSQTAFIFSTYHKFLEKNHKRFGTKYKKAKILNLVVCPFTYSLQRNHGQKSFNYRTIFQPMWFHCQINLEGDLVAPSEKLPWIDRKWLEPLMEDEVLSIGSVEDYDRFATENSLDDVESWEEFRVICTNLKETFKEVGKKEYSFDVVKYNKRPLSTVYILEDYFDHVREGLIKLCKDIKTESDLPLYSNIINGNNGKRSVLTLKQEVAAAKDHLGQMNKEFELGASQRQSLHHYCQSKNGDITAINGPPGTGKTTLIQSVIATELVRKATAGDPPPLIVATGATNKAVNNIISDFGGMLEGEGLSRRWLDEPLKSLGAFAVSGNQLDKVPETRDLFHCITTKGKGFFRKLENDDYITSAKKYFIQCFNDEFGYNYKATSIQQARTFLRNKCKESTKAIKKHCQALQEMMRADGRISKLERKVVEAKKDLGEYKKNRKELINLINTKSEDYSESETPLEQLGAFLAQEGFFYTFIYSLLSPYCAAIKKRRLARLLVFIGQPKKIHLHDSVESFEKHLRDLQSSIKDEIEKLINARSNLERNLGWLEYDIPKWEEEKEKLVTSLDEYKKDHNVQGFEADDVYNILGSVDKNFRYEAFLYAMHYYEACWLQQAKVVEEEDEKKEWECPKKLTKMWYRFANLTPCIVATQYMLPKFFRATKRPYKQLFNEADLLIIDEAGQAPTEKVACLFSLAKRALVVGDTHQLEPIWEITTSIDCGNLNKYAKAKIKENYVPEKFEAFCASSGSAMILAQRACKTQLPLLKEPGLQLRDHRRCHRDIIAYCKEIVGAYKELKPHDLTKDRPSDFEYLQRMGLVVVNGTPERRGTSWINEQEAVVIANWLKANGTKLMRAYNAPLEEIVAVLTPYARQGNCLRSTINHSNLTIGTVHSLQGDEKPIVLFSLVCGENGDGVPWIKSNKRIMNVAVSRAKHSFLVFGNPKSLPVGGDDCLSVLNRHLVVQAEEGPPF
ncbi:AAA domain-containing protein [Pseudodesulfovibrio sp.]|nr:AAA domain-containing protein [Pseudodesulfovibrio sp.]